MTSISSGGAKEVAKIFDMGEEDARTTLSKHGKVGTPESIRKALLNTPASLLDGSGKVTPVLEQVKGHNQGVVDKCNTEQATKMGEKKLDSNISVENPKWNVLVKGNTLAARVAKRAGADLDGSASENWTYVGRTVKRKSEHLSSIGVVATNNEFEPLEEHLLPEVIEIM
ncbi:hypothetical protein HAX54_049993 [Datura stramonium]|uniref:Uncharacterized protein n=1 Tax=Datura stramonium TaxID=4076 RepID=A0ABS8SXE7_DATST|nr:hypothetical protein [Datura stramonium]